ncbi:MAG: hypothetical protein J4F43_02145 [Dehalococcoidia bacterium]|nr:hypothetical protein [Dehalococcoidia bacterium]
MTQDDPDIQASCPLPVDVVEGAMIPMQMSPGEAQADFRARWDEWCATQNNPNIPCPLP